MPTPTCIYLDGFVDEPIIMYVHDVCGLGLAWTFDFSSILSFRGVSEYSVFCILPRENEGPFHISWFCKIHTADTRYRGQLIRANLCAVHGEVITLPAVLLHWGLNFSIQQHGVFSVKRKPIEKQRGVRNLREIEEIRGCHCVSMNMVFCPFHFQGLPTPLEQFFFVGGPELLTNRFWSLTVTSIDCE